MHVIRLRKIITPSIFASFSKLKLNQPMPRPTIPGLKTNSSFKSPVLDKNTKTNLNLVEQRRVGKVETEMMAKKQEEAPIYKQKHPVVTIMGHVDHGKTTLIDYLRNSDIAQKQHGGITQRIGAFRINCGGQRVTFIDTPGHEAFTNMRQRGASVTDLIVLVVSAVEGVKKQTLQVIELIKKLQIPIIVAINKIDLPQANVEQTEAQLQKAGLNLQINNGNIPAIHISAKTGSNVDLLCELILQETKDKNALFNGMVQASVLQAFQTKQGLNSMTVIIQKGTLKIGSILVIQNEVFKVKTILGDRDEFLNEAYPGQAVQIVGIPFIPSPGDLVLQIQNQKKAKFFIQKNKCKDYEQSRISKKGQNKQINATKIKFQKGREGRQQKKAFCRGVRQVWMNKFADEQQKIMSKISELKKQAGNEVIDSAILQLQQQLQAHKQYVYEYLRNTGDSPDTLNFMIKFADRGMEETILMQLQKLKPSIEQETKVKLNLIKTDVGDVNVGDIQQSKNCSAKIFTYGSGVSAQAKNYLNGEDLPRTHKLIHNLLKDIKETSFNKKISSIKGVERGRCDVAELFTIKGKRKEAGITVPGIKVTSGKITKKCKAYIFRGGIPISSPLDINFLKSFKKEMMELKKGEEGTIGFLQQVENIQKGDQLAFYQQV